ncbi:hypothetical protein AAG906_018785 [Vitis piasezkii]
MREYKYRNTRDMVLLEISGKRGTTAKSILSDSSTHGPKVVSPYPYSVNPSPGI